MKQVLLMLTALLIVFTLMPPAFAQSKNDKGKKTESKANDKKDMTDKIKMYRQEAAKGNANAQYNLAVCYYNGEGIKKDLAEAAKWAR